MQGQIEKKIEAALLDDLTLSAHTPQGNVVRVGYCAVRGDLVEY